jgi:hypothetical protein
VLFFYSLLIKNTMSTLTARRMNQSIIMLFNIRNRFAASLKLSNDKETAWNATLAWGAPDIKSLSETFGDCSVVCDQIRNGCSVKAAVQTANKVQRLQGEFGIKISVYADLSEVHKAVLQPVLDKTEQDDKPIVQLAFDKALAVVKAHRGVQQTKQNSKISNAAAIKKGHADTNLFNLNQTPKVQNPVHTIADPTRSYLSVEELLCPDTLKDMPIEANLDLWAKNVKLAYQDYVTTDHAKTKRRVKVNGEVVTQYDPVMSIEEFEPRYVQTAEKLDADTKDRNEEVVKSKAMYFDDVAMVLGIAIELASSLQAFHTLVVGYTNLFTGMQGDREYGPKYGPKITFTQALFMHQLFSPVPVAVVRAWSDQVADTTILQVVRHAMANEGNEFIKLYELDPVQLTTQMQFINEAWTRTREALASDQQSEQSMNLLRSLPVVEGEGEVASYDRTAENPSITDMLRAFYQKQPYIEDSEDFKFDGEGHGEGEYKFKEVLVADVSETEGDTQIGEFAKPLELLDVSDEEEEQAEEKATTFGGGDMYFAPCLRRSLVKMLMTDRGISLNDCMDRTCACSFTPSLSYADRRVLNQTALSSGGRKLMRDQIRAMYPLLR